MSDSASAPDYGLHTHLLRKRITQLEAEVRAVRKQAQAQRQRIAQKCGHEFLALIESEVNCKVVVTDFVQKLVFQDEEATLLLRLMVLWWVKLLR